MRFLRHAFILAFISSICITFLPSAEAFWIWTPESGKWVNPKYAVKPSPQEQLEYANGFFVSGRYAEAMREYKKLLQHYGKAREAATAQFYIGRSWEEMKNYFEAVENYQKVVDRYPFSDLGPKVVERQYLIANLLLEGKARDKRLATTLLGSTHNVVEIFEKVIKNDPYGTYAPAARFKIGLFHLEQGAYQLARDEFEKTLNDYPDSKWAESAKYQIAVADSKRSVSAQYDQGATTVAVEGFKEFLEANPESELSEAARQEIERLKVKEAENAFLVAEFYEKQKKMKAARIYYQEVVDNYAGTVWAEKAAVRVRMIDEGGMTP
ncbi:MAG: outer membrane protein assembly factor BamD [Elusimicrobia bacterium]|nr:outer membrane protein assembly factor BamD [Elusimicrobiota bacterium]